LKHFEELFDSSYKILFGDTRPQAKKLVPDHSERKAGREKMGQIPENFCGRVLAPEERVIFVTGPEKGFSDKELKWLDNHGSGISLHKNILRAETAPIAAICLLEGIK
jgi:16S rRNA U1498 N3-methylase RsmE